MSLKKVLEKKDSESLLRAAMRVVNQIKESHEASNTASGFISLIYISERDREVLEYLLNDYQRLLKDRRK